MQWAELFYLLGIALAGWLLWHTIKRNPNMFTRSNLARSATTLGVLALLLIAFVFVLIWLTRSA